MAALPPPELTALLRHADWLHRLARRLCADEHAAEDAVQDIWAQALRRPPRHTDNLRGWLAQLLRHAVGMRNRSDRRRHAREAGLAEPSFAEAAVETAQRADLHRRLGELVLALPEPQRTLVLLHYLEGHEVAVLARRFASSADAIRGHLRRARATLRERLADRDDGARRAFAAMLATTPLTTLTMTTTTKAILGLCAAAALLVLYAAWPPTPPVPRPADERASDVVAAVAAPRDVGGAPPPSTATVADRDDATPAAKRAWTVHLDGLRADTPWQANVHVGVEGRDDAAGAWLREDLLAEFVGGVTATVVQPPWWQHATQLQIRLRADDPNYLPFDLRLRDDDDGLRARELYDLPIQVIGVLCGRVVDGRGEPVPAARVTAFAAEAGVAALAGSNTAVDGSYRLQVPPGTPLLVTAVPMHEASISGKRLTGQHGAIADDGRARDDLLPAGLPAIARAGTATGLADLVLDAPAFVVGRVTFADGTPIAKAAVAVIPRAERSLQVDDGLGLVRLADGSLSIAASVASDDAGTFRVSCRAGVPITAHLQTCPPCPIVGGSLRSDGIAPAELTIEVPLPITVRVTQGGQPCPTASLEVRGKPLAPGLRFALCGELAGLRARSDGWRSRPIDLGPADAGRTIDLALDEALAPLAIRFAGAAVWSARFELTPLQDGEPCLANLQRYDLETPFRLFAKPGRYLLGVGPNDGMRTANSFLFEHSQEIEVGPDGGAWTLPAATGGRIRVGITDPNGRGVGGEFTVRDAAGREIPIRMTTAGNALHLEQPRDRGTAFGLGTPGQLFAADDNLTYELLAAGDYDLAIDLGALGMVRRTVTVRAGEVAEVRIRLP